SGTAFIGISKGFTVSSVGADGNLLLILDSDTTRYTCTFENVPYGWVVENLLPVPEQANVRLIRTSTDIDDLYNSTISKIA
ncbi:MAG: hypothetical protein FWD71_16210, partial [Oscillospiraceae bacterium]|nr:hypothetical protein [Oscillospiraceae bacterium]